MGPLLYFLHIPRTAGTSVTGERSPLRPQDVFPGQLLHTIAQVRPEELRRHRLFRGHFGVVLPNLLDWRVQIFTLVREPVAHVLSILSCVRQFPWHPLHDRPAWSGGTLAAKLRDPVFAAMHGNFQSRALVADPPPTVLPWRIPPTSAEAADWRGLFAGVEGSVWANGQVWGT